MDIDQEVEQFAAELEKVNWYELDVSQFTTEQLHETIHRHVTMMHVHGHQGNLKLHTQHMEMLSSVVDELERRRLALRHQNKGPL